MKAWISSSGVCVAGGWIDSTVGDDSGAAEGDAAGEGVSVGKGIAVGVTCSVRGVEVGTTVAGIAEGTAVVEVAAGCSLTVAVRQALVNRIRLQIIHNISGRRGRMLNGILLQVNPGQIRTIFYHADRASFISTGRKERGLSYAARNPPSTGMTAP
jgi:hypothetical protein